MPTEAEVLRQFQVAALEIVARSGELNESLDQLCCLVDQVICDSICSAFLLDDSSGELTVAAAPGAPPELFDALHGLPSSDIGSSSRIAVFEQPNFVSDTSRDPRWKRLQPVCSNLGITAFWSVPIFSSEGIAIGLFAAYRLIEGEPTAHEEQILVAASSVGSIAIERKQAEIAVRETQKLEGLGAMAGSIAHEYNNLLAVIVGNADLAISSGNLKPPVSKWIADIQTASKRATELTRQLHEYSGSEIFCVETIDLPALVAEIAELRRSTPSRNIAYQRQNRNESLYISGDVDQVRRAVMSLIAISEGAISSSADTIYIRTGVFTTDRAYLQQSYAGERLPEGDYVYVEVHDSRGGMTDDVLRLICDPFFTSKTCGRGVGLVTALGIIKRHKGALHLENALVTGSTYRVLFPRRILATAPAVSDVVRKIDASTGTVLVVDDEPMVVSVAKQMLSGQGLHVLTAYDGEQGVSIARQHAGEIDAVVLDATMPKMSGDDTFRALRDICNDLPVIFCSGQPATFVLNLVEGKKLTGFVSKPFESSVLYEAVVNLIERRQSLRDAAKDDRASSDVAPDIPLQTDSPQKTLDS